MKKLTILFLALFALNTAWAQNNKVVSTWNYLRYYERDKDKDALGKAKEAIDAATVHEKTMSDPKTFYYRGLVYEAIHNAEDANLKALDDAPLDKAFAAYEKSLKLDEGAKHKNDVLQQVNNLYASYFNEGVALYKEQKFNEAYLMFEKANAANELINKNIEQNKQITDTITILNLAMAADNAGMDDKAKTHYEKLLELNFNDSYVFSALSSIYMNEGNTERGLEVIEKGRELHPTNKFLMNAELNYYISTKQHETAVEKFKGAIDIDPENPELRFILGRLYQEVGENDDAEDAYEKAVELKPDYADAWYHLGALEYNQAIAINKQMNDLSYKEVEKFNDLKEDRDELFEEARPSFEKILEIEDVDDNTMLDTLSALKEIYAKMGMYDKSNEMKQRILEIRGEE